MTSNLLSSNLTLLPLFFLLFLFISSKAQIESMTDPNEIKLDASMTHIHFFFHDIVSGNNPSAITVTQPISGSMTSFGMINIMDDKLTEGPDISSTEVGRAQGFYASACQGELGFMQSMNLVFTSGQYNGSSISVMGRNAPMHTTREMSIVGGTGLFRMARGFAIAKTHTLDYSTGDATVEYDVYVNK
ncbi:hypothetical protein LUZ60_007749 [Juncus effusus]|nr:hypothetical protein LUZ60_007749 [Juncus effusus]